MSDGDHINLQIERLVRQNERLRVYMRLIRNALEHAITINDLQNDILRIFNEANSDLE